MKTKHFLKEGDRFGRLTVIEKAPAKKASYLCRCDCGTIKPITTNALIRGLTRSCGCLQKELVRARMMKTLDYETKDGYALCKTKSGQTFVIDTEDLEKVKNHSWYKGKNGYICGDFDGHRYLLHRFLMNPPAGLMVDHINHDRTDNRKANLRITTALVNSRNRTKEPVGITIKKCGLRTYYIVNIKRQYGGCFKTYEEAKAVRDKIWGNGYERDLFCCRGANSPEAINKVLQRSLCATEKGQGVRRKG